LIINLEEFVVFTRSKNLEGVFVNYVNSNQKEGISLNGFI